MPAVGYFTYSYSPIFDDDDAVGGVLLVTQDTTARVLAERRLEALRELAARSMDAPTERQACEQAANALASSPDVPFALTYLIDNGRERAECVSAISGSGELAPASPIIDLRGSRDELSSLFRALADRGTDGMLVDAGRFVVPDRRGRRLPRQAFVAPMARGDSDPVRGFVVAGVCDELQFDEGYQSFLNMASSGIGRSVAAARAREAERERADAIAALDRAKTALFSDASHELRTPLAVILGNLDEMLEGEALPETGRGLVLSARRSALRMLKLVEALLDFSRIEAGVQIAHFYPTDIARLTGEITAAFRASVERAGLRLVVDCPPLGEPVYVDPEAWERIVSNLLSNALKFTRNGEIRVQTRAQDGHLRLCVADTGIGIAPHDAQRVFERFYRAADPGARTHEGLGIGLALVRELLGLHGGSIEAESNAGGGTRMIVRVPLGTRHLPGGAIAPPRTSSAPGASAARFVAEADGWFDPRPRSREQPPLGLARVLVAEDNADMREYLRRLLSTHFAVELAREGADALERALRDPPSAVITDVMMPGLDGFELIRALRGDVRTRTVPVILVSARADPESTIQALALGADDYIVKPFGARELLARVRSTVESSRVRAEASAASGRKEESARRDGELRALLNDLRAAQRRVAAAGDAERRRIARDVHDGAQQRLLAIRLELGILSEALDGVDAGTAATLSALREQLDAALEELRELAHGLYPPLLASDGLYAAPSAIAGRAAIPVTIEAKGVSRAPRSIESAAYFCCLEAIQNSAKHGGSAASAKVRLSSSNGVLEFRVEDDGVGFDADAVRPGHGLINMHDRLDALGGHAEVASRPGQGTVVRGQIPLP
jgi:signal transduction histidine kinase